MPEHSYFAAALALKADEQIQFLDIGCKQRIRSEFGSVQQYAQLP